MGVDFIYITDTVRCYTCNEEEYYFDEEHPSKGYWRNDTQTDEYIPILNVNNVNKEINIHKFGKDLTQKLKQHCNELENNNTSFIMKSIQMLRNELNDNNDNNNNNNSNIQPQRNRQKVPKIILTDDDSDVLDALEWNTDDNKTDILSMDDVDINTNILEDDDYDDLGDEDYEIEDNDMEDEDDDLADSNKSTTLEKPGKSQKTTSPVY